MRRTDQATGLIEVIDLPCGATREDKCPACAKRAKRLRPVQIREGRLRRLFDQHQSAVSRTTDQPIPLCRHVTSVPASRWTDSPVEFALPN